MKIPGFPGKRQRTAPSPDRKSTFLLPALRHWYPWVRQLLDWAVTSGSVLLCLLMLPTRLPGMELLGIGPNWVLIWVVAWSVKRSLFVGAFAGIVIGLLQDGMTSPNPTHAISLGIVGMLTGLIQKQRFIQEDFISIALIVFGMAVLADTIFAVQLSFTGDRKVEDIWTYYQRVALASAILSSLWAPVVYYPLNRWWQQTKLIRNS
ncbi:rod shape-determining protein MreD [Anabaena sp. PCC 7108]|uniref:rod shape-determining protein MreD n=1 Tax=Anabaena sp. PCC 7108 TaxID=163908 RepID=UPI000348D783|nr:rod shape-determining protein MreD [Anabaena sp. PCC 7108]